VNPKVVIYCDGACSPNPGIGAWWWPETRRSSSRLPDLPLAPEAALGRNDQARARGLRLCDTLGEPRP